MRFAVLADAHIGRSIPLAIAEHRRRAFSRAFTKAVDTIVEAGVDYVFICGDLFERRSLRPHLVQFTHDELYRLVKETEERHGMKVRILLIRGNHDGRPQSNTLDYLKHPLAEYLHIFDEDALVYTDKNLTVVGLNYYDEIDRAYELFAKPALQEAVGLKILMVHGFIFGYNSVPDFTSSISLDKLAEASPDYVFSGHYHRKCKEKYLSSGGIVLSPGSLEMYDFGEHPEKGFYIVDHGPDPKVIWKSLEPMHIMKRVLIETVQRKDLRWFNDEILEQVNHFRAELKKKMKPGYLRVNVKGPLKDGFPGEIDKDQIDALVQVDPLLLWVNVDTLDVQMPILSNVHGREAADIVEFFSTFGEFAHDIKEMHGLVNEALEESASLQTGLLTPSLREPIIEKWVKRFEAKVFREDES